MSKLTDEDQFQLTREHILRDHGWAGEPVSRDNVTITFAEHPAIHEFESARAKYNAVIHTIKIAVHRGTPDPED